ncbi:hypothetical protein V6B08_19260 [Ferrovibrio sp. MS7]|jgi:plasmid maintenance system antidote protein VapI|uniref:helix-turn-helix transcriptional regulator n=1 Tax=Ferrovibrio TaxID=1231242 RepID=UPI001B60AFEE|nr:hypothetical protein [Ferrovibrio sp.]
MLPLYPITPPPNKLLLQAIASRGYSPERFRVETRIKPRLFRAVISGKRPIKLGTAMRLGRFFGTSPWVWIAFQERYDKAV